MSACCQSTANIRVLGITVGYHRLFTYRSFRATAPARAALAVLASMAGQGGVISWAGLHEIRQSCGVGLVRDYQAGAGSLCETCRTCPITGVCGGGYLPHRYRLANGFDNPSVFCLDLLKLITHIQNRILGTIPDATRRKLGVSALSFEQARSKLRPARNRPKTLKTAGSPSATIPWESRPGLARRTT